MPSWAWMGGRILVSPVDGGDDWSAVRPRPQLRGQRGGTSGRCVSWTGDFLACDVPLTNFRRPRSTLLMMLVSCCRERLLDLYVTAEQERYRFYRFSRQ